MTVERSTTLRRLAHDRSVPLTDSDRDALLAGAEALELAERERRSEEPTGRFSVPPVPR